MAMSSDGVSVQSDFLLCVYILYLEKATCSDGGKVQSAQENRNSVLIKGYV